MQTRRTTRPAAHYVCAGCGRAFQTILKLYGHEKSCKSRKRLAVSAPAPNQSTYAHPPEVARQEADFPISTVPLV